MGVVWRAFDRSREEQVAVKTLHELAPQELFWLKQEFRALADTRHRNLVELHELFAGHAEAFFSMELVDGFDLTTFLRRAAPTGRDLGESATTVLREVFAQIVYGVRAVHRAGKLHRDLKPQNILVTTVGRVVVLDFGLSRPAEVSGTRRALLDGLSGTPAYMSPEQAEGAPPAPSADWYSLGVLLFEALAGALPFDGSFAEMLLRKQRGSRDPRDVAPEAPPALCALAAALLHPSPDQRPEADAILESLGFAGHDEHDSGAAWFLGRHRELGELHRCLERSEHGPVSVHVRGESGIGKSALLERFTRQLEANETALVLRGRCHPRESVPYKALDSVVDELRLHLMDRRIDAGALPLRDRFGLRRIFPVLADLLALDGGLHDQSSPDPFEARRQGARALKALLRELSERRRVVVWIDDLHWGDADSAWVVRFLMDEPEPSRLLWLFSYRSELHSPLLSDLQVAPLESRSAARVDLDVSSLEPDAASTLARLCLGDDGDRADVVVSTAGGSPFFIAELARHGRPGGRAGAPLDLGALIRKRCGALEADALRLLEVCSLATAAFPADQLVAAAGLPPSAVGLAVRLQAQGLVTLAPHRSGQTIQPYHDQVRRAVVESLSLERQRAHHAEICRVLSGCPGIEAEDLLYHWLEAGDRSGAAEAALRAAERAEAALAFDRAAELYAQALQLRGDSEERGSLIARHGAALESAGQTSAAAEQYLLAASSRESTAPVALDLRRRSAVAFLKAGHVARGKRLLLEVLEELGVTMPRGETAALRAAMWNRLPLLVGKLRPDEFSSGEMSQEATMRLEALWGAVVGMIMTEHHTAAYLGVLFAREALATRLPIQVARAMGHEAVFEGALRLPRFRRHGERILAEMDRIADWIDDPYTTAHAEISHGHNEWARGRWRRALEHCERSARILKERCHGVSWEIAVANVFGFSSLSFLGRMGALSTRVEAEYREATERGDRFAAANYRLGQPAFYGLAEDRADEVLAQADDAIESFSGDRFSVPHYNYVTLVTQVHLYRGDLGAAWSCIDGSWPALAAAQLLQLEFQRAELLHLRARVALALLLDRDASVPHTIERGRLRRCVRQAIRGLRRARTVSAAPWRHTLEAGLARDRGDDAAAIGHLDAAVRGFREGEMGLYRDAHLMALGHALGGEEGAGLRARAWRGLEAEAKRPEAVARALGAGLF